MCKAVVEIKEEGVDETLNTLPQIYERLMAGESKKDIIASGVSEKVVEPAAQMLETAEKMFKSSK